MDEAMECWSGSDTPGLLDDEGPFHTDELLAVIDCKFNEPHQNCFTILQSGFVSRLLSAEMEPLKQDKKIVYFFERPFVNNAMFIPKLRSSLFNCVRSAIFQLMRKASEGFQATNEDDLHKVREDIRKVIYFCNETISTHTNSDFCVVHKDLIKDFESLLKSIGTVLDLINLYSLRKMKNDRILYALFHVQLELHIHRVLLIFKYLVRNRYEAATDRSLFTRSSTLLVHHLVLLSYHIYKRISTSCKSIWEDEFFMCVCVKQVWVTLILVINDFSKTFHEHNFWSVLTNLLQNDIFDGAKPNSESKSEFPVEFKVWILCNVAPLFRIDPSGNIDDKSLVAANWQLMQDLIKDTSTEATFSSSAFGSILWSCICLTKHWDLDLNIFHTIWNFIIKDINIVKKHETQNLDNCFKTVKSLSAKFELIMTYLARSNVSCLEIDDGNFEYFLRFLIVTVQIVKSKNDMHLLSQVKGKIYSKFHKRSMNTMNVAGLERFTTLFTVLSLVIGTEEIPKKMVVYVSLLQFNQQTMEVRKLIIQSAFLALMVCKKLQLPAGDIVQKIISLFKSLIRMLHDMKKKKEHYSQSWNLLCFHLDCVEQCFDYNLLISEEAQLICPVYAELLAMTSDSQKNKIFSHLITILSSSYLQQPNLSSRDYDLVWKNIHLSLSGLEIDDRNSEHLAEIFASISILSVKRTSSTERQHFDLLLNNYGFSNVSTQCKCFYISRILSSSAAVERIKQLNKSNDVIRVWITYVIQELHKSPEVVINLTRSIINSPDIFHWVFQIECTRAEHVENVLFQFISHLGKKCISLSTLNQLTDFRKTINLYFSDLISSAENIIFHGTCERSMAFIFKVAGHLVECCAKCIYSKSSPSCLLPQILAILVLPVISAKKPPPIVLLKNIRIHLHYFLCGLATLDVNTDTFLNRKLKEIMQKYFVEFCIRSTKDSSEKNPFLVSLHGSCVESPTKVATEYRNIMLGYIRDHFLIIKSQPLEQLSSVLNFILELATDTKSQVEKVNTIQIVSMKMVACILVCDQARNDKSEPEDIRRFSMNILRKLFQSADVATLDILKGLLEKFIRDNVRNYQSILLTTMQSICLVSPSVVKSLLPYIETLVFEEEKVRGTGIDGALRQSLRELKLFLNSITKNL